MTDSVVLDASAGVAVVRREPERDRVVEVLRDRTVDAPVLVPGHFWLEVANVLGRRYRMSADDILAAVQLLDAFGVQTIEVDRPLWLLTLDRMAAFGLSAYDAAYLALAEAMDAHLLTLDARLGAAAGPRALPRGTGRLAEDPAPYASVDLGSVWAAHGRYLAALRRDVLASG